MRITAQVLNGLKGRLKPDTDGDGEYDLYKYCDGISVHHYIGDLKRISTDGEKLKTLLANYGFADKKLYHTEFGYTETIRSNGKWVYRGEEKQASFLAKYASSLRAKKSGDRFYIYDFSNDGLAENQPSRISAWLRVLWQMCRMRQNLRSLPLRI